LVGLFARRRQPRRQRPPDALKDHPLPRIGANPGLGVSEKPPGVDDRILLWRACPAQNDRLLEYNLVAEADPARVRRHQSSAGARRKLDSAEGQSGLDAEKG